MLEQLILSHQYETNFNAEEPLDFNYQNDPHSWIIKLSSRQNFMNSFPTEFPDSEFTFSKSITDVAKSLNSIYRNTKNK